MGRPGIDVEGRQAWASRAAWPLRDMV